jgi:hypothetical protein
MVFCLCPCPKIAVCAPARGASVTPSLGLDRVVGRYRRRPPGRLGRLAGIGIGPSGRDQAAKSRMGRRGGRVGREGCGPASRIRMDGKGLCDHGPCEANSRRLGKWIQKRWRRMCTDIGGVRRALILFLLSIRPFRSVITRAMATSQLSRRATSGSIDL